MSNFYYLSYYLLMENSLMFCLGICFGRPPSRYFHLATYSQNLKIMIFLSLLGSYLLIDK